MNKLVSFSVISIVIFTFSCGNKLAPSDFKKYVENDENGFIQRIQLQSYKITCMYMPTDYMVVNYFRKDNIAKDAFETQAKEYKPFDLYRLEISTDDPRNMQGLEEYIAFNMQNNIVKVINGDTVPCLVYNAEPFNSIVGTQKIEMGFIQDPTAEVKIILKNTPFSPEDISFFFNKSNITIPDIKLN